MVQPPTEDLILEIVKKKRLVSADELSRILYMTKPNIHYHLKKMLLKGSIEEIKGISRLTRRRGRPDLFYRLSTVAAENNIIQFCDLLLCQQKNKGNIYKSLASKLLPPPPADAPMPILLRNLVDELNLRAYGCRWEAHKSGPVIMFSNCPYAPIINRHPDICQMDASMLESYLCLPVEQNSRIDIKSNLPTMCQFSVKT